MCLKLERTKHNSKWLPYWVIIGNEFNFFGLWTHSKSVYASYDKPNYTTDKYEISALKNYRVDSLIKELFN
jgi:hypothetical protein